MTNKQELHDELDALIPQNEAGMRATSSYPRMIGHCLIELGLLTSIECGYEHCDMDDRKFERDPKNRNGGRKWITVDHVVELCDGGHERPDNLQLMHLGCNARKGSKAFIADPARRTAHSEMSKKRWQDPEYATKVNSKVRAALSDPDVKAKRSASMKAHWADPERKKRHSDALKKSWDRRKASQMCTEAEG